MTQKITEWQSSLAEMLPEDFIHPSLRTVRFVFCDDQPNENGEGIRYEDFAELTRSAIGTPIKMRFLGQNVGGHNSSIPIGHIKNITEREEGGVHQLIADGILYAEEYPDEVTWLEQRYAEGKAPGLSWEVSYNSTKSTVENGVKWLKGLLTRAATFVRNPAYGNRTAILALASNRNLSADEFYTELLALASNDNKPNTEKEGGNNRMDEKEIQKLRDDLAAAQAALASRDADLAAANTKVAELTTENTTLQASVTEKDQAIAEFAKKETLGKRLAAITEAGITLETEPEKKAKREAFYLSLSDEAFAEYVDELKGVAEKAAEAAKSTTRSTASRHAPIALPRFDGRADAEVESTSASDLMAKLRGISRSPATTE
jgi:hypothetical protein